MAAILTFGPLVEAVIRARRAKSDDRALAVGISGIDGSGKGWLADQLRIALNGVGQRVAILAADQWLNLPPIRFSQVEPGLHFYRHGLRLDDFHRRLVGPLTASRSIELLADVVDETATDPRPLNLSHDDVDIVLAEGIFLFQPRFRTCYDLRIWVDCPFATALDRAVARAQEGLPPAATIAAYRTIYFPAQRHHLAVDHPVATADYLFPNHRTDTVGP